MCICPILNGIITPIADCNIIIYMISVVIKKKVRTFLVSLFPYKRSLE